MSVFCSVGVIEGKAMYLTGHVYWKWMCTRRTFGLSLSLLLSHYIHCTLNEKVKCLVISAPFSLSLSLSLQLCGCGLLGVGIWLAVSQGSFATFSPSFPSLSAANLVIAIGAIVMVTGFLGCLGAIKENKCLLLSVSIEYS